MTAYVIFDVRTVDREALKPYIEKAFDTLIPYLLLAIQSATFRSCTWGAAWSQKPRALVSVIFLCLKEKLTNSLTND